MRFLQLLERLKQIDPVFDHWFWGGGNEEPISFDEVRDQLPVAIAAAIERADDGDPVPIGGYMFFVVNSLLNQPRALDVFVNAGSWSVAEYVTNHVKVGTPWRVTPDPALVTFSIFKPVVLALAESFDATWCSAYPDAVMKFWPIMGLIRLAWISYVGPRFAPLITPPTTAIVERQPNGGLLMAATDEPFDVSNPAHLTAANDILTAVEPLRAMQWPLDREPAPVNGVGPTP